VVEGARLESVYTGNRIAGSNPALSARAEAYATIISVMKLTKYEHACIVLEEANQKVIVDPGNFTQSLSDVSNVVALVITHEHMDHFEPRFIEQITQENPDVLIFVPEGLETTVDTDAVVHVVKAGDEHEVEPFTLKFYGAKHALIHKTIPQPSNIGVLINGTVYYPGDSFDTPDVRPSILLAPVSGPWLKIGETIDFIDEVKPQICIPTHNALQSEIATSLTEVWLRGVCKKHGITFQHLEPGASINC
jgi:L-ascorbate metabolism protein UlaG (beta-lactamase superfamily)